MQKISKTVKTKEQSFNPIIVGIIALIAIILMLVITISFSLTTPAKRNYETTLRSIAPELNSPAMTTDIWEVNIKNIALCFKQNRVPNKQGSMLGSLLSGNVTNTRNRETFTVLPQNNYCQGNYSGYNHYISWDIEFTNKTDQSQLLYFKDGFKQSLEINENSGNSSYIYPSAVQEAGSRLLSNNYTLEPGQKQSHSFYATINNLEDISSTEASTTNIELNMSLQDSDTRKIELQTGTESAIGHSLNGKIFSNTYNFGNLTYWQNNTVYNAN